VAFDLPLEGGLVVGHTALLEMLMEGEHGVDQGDHIAMNHKFFMASNICIQRGI